MQALHCALLEFLFSLCLLYFKHTKIPELKTQYSFLDVVASICKG